MIKRNTNQQDPKSLTSILPNLNNFHSFEVKDRVSETQLQMGGNFHLIIWRLTGVRGLVYDMVASCVS